MVKLYLLFSLVSLALGIYCLVGAITARNEQVRHLPKVAWIVLILLFPFVGSVAWLVAGRPRTPRPAPYERPAPGFPEYDRPGRAAGLTPESDEQFLRRVRERAEEQRRRAAEEKAREPREPDA